ncbi:hypothetical protein JCM19235_3834 [Vibrio maritimus]|uniref:Uncharacterized protein n=1 Tax=Vibrio maritimus TaxID=990268 RepID=A0A090SN68_9VIBR|nr:hypothetical protein JCM19235_3834 [Vibrio maritimus]
MFLVFCAFAYAWYLTAGLDNRYHYVLSELGVVKKHNRAEPAWVNKAMQVIAWGCAIGCIFAVAIAGPMALAGSGILVLLAFGMMKRQPENQITTVIGERDDWLFAEYHLKRKVIVLWSRYDVCVHWNKSKEEVARDQTRGPLYLFFNTEDELKAAVEFLSSETKLACKVRANKKELFDQKRFPQELENLPVYGEIYTFDEAIERRKDPLARPGASYVIDGEWLSEKEWKETQKATISAMSQ